MEVFELAGEKWSVPFFKSHSIEECVRVLNTKRPDQVRNVWKQINGKSVRTKKKTTDD